MLFMSKYIQVKYLIPKPQKDKFTDIQTALNFIPIYTIQLSTSNVIKHYLNIASVNCFYLSFKLYIDMIYYSWDLSIN